MTTRLRNLWAIAGVVGALACGCGGGAATPADGGRTDAAVASLPPPDAAGMDLPSPDANVACSPATCQTLGRACGEAPDGCGGTIACGWCKGLEFCDRQLGQCVPKAVALASAQPVFFMAWRGKHLYTRTGMSEADYIKVANQLAAATQGNIWFVRAINQTKESPLNKTGAEAFFSHLRAGCTSCTEHSLFLGRLSFQQFTTASAMESEMTYYLDTLGVDGAFLDFATATFHDHPKLFKSVMQWATATYPRAAWIMNSLALGNPPTVSRVPTSYGPNMYVDISPAYGDPTLAFPKADLTVVREAGYTGRVIFHIDSNETDPTCPNYYFSNSSNADQLSVLQRFYRAQKARSVKFEIPVFGGPAIVSCLGTWYLYNSQTFGTAAQSTYPNILNLIATGLAGSSAGPAACP